MQGQRVRIIRGTFKGALAMIRDVLGEKVRVSLESKFKVLEIKAVDLPRIWAYFDRKDLHKLSAVDATSFMLMTASRIRCAFTFDHHFVTAGFRLLG